MSDYKLLWCPIFKAASTNWMKNIVTLSGYSKKDAKYLEKKFRGYGIFQASSERTNFVL